MKLFFFSLLSLASLHGQFLEPEWRGLDETNHAEWDVFTEARTNPNFPDVAADEDASITGTTSSAFITSGGNIYSFSAPTFFQLDDSTDFPVANVFLQISALGSGVDLDTVRLIYSNAEGETIQVFPGQVMTLSEEELGGERGGIGSVYTMQWDLSDEPISGAYTILFNAEASSMSLGAVSLDTSASFMEVSFPQSLSLSVEEGLVNLSWLGDGQLQTCISLNENDWVEVVEARGVNEVSLPIESSSAFYRVQQVSSTE